MVGKRTLEITLRRLYMDTSQEEETSEPSLWEIAGQIAGTIIFILLELASCNRPSSPILPPTAPATAVSYPDPTTFRIVAESAVKTLQDAGILDDFTKETGIQLTIDYAGPVDIRNAVSMAAG